MVSRVPAALATCPCHSRETPSDPCSPVSVPVQTPPPWGRLAPWLHSFWVRRHLLGCLRATGTLESPQSSPLCHSHPCPCPRCILRAITSQESCRCLLFPLLPLKGGPIICPSPLHPWYALKGSPSASDTASLFISNPFFPAWKLLTSLPGQEYPHM